MRDRQRERETGRQTDREKYIFVFIIFDEGQVISG